MIDNLEPKPDMWEANPKLKMLSLVFIFVFLFSGIALVMFSVWSNQYRQKIYEETQNSLPKHEISKSASQQISDSEIKDWKTYKNDQYGFEFKYPQQFSDFFTYTTSQQVDIFHTAASSTQGSIVISISSDKFDPSNIKSIYGKINNPEKTEVGSQVGYGYMNGDGGCGGWFVQTSFKEGMMEISFDSCEWDVGTALYDDRILISTILSSFKFTK